MIQNKTELWWRNDGWFASHGRAPFIGVPFVAVLPAALDAAREAPPPAKEE